MSTGLLLWCWQKERLETRDLHIKRATYGPVQLERGSHDLTDCLSPSKASYWCWTHIVDIIRDITRPTFQQLNHLSTDPALLTKFMYQSLYFSPFASSLQKSPNSPFVPCAMSCSSLEPYFFLYSTLIFSKCCGSQWNLTKRLMSNSIRSLDVSAKAWWRRRASRTGRLSTPLRMCASVSP